MRILLLPVTTQRSVIFCQRITAPRVRSKPRLDERIASKVGSVYSNFEKSDKKWKQTLVRWTGKMLDTVPFEENGLKTVPPLNTYMRKLKSSSSHITDKQAIEKDMTHKLEPIELVFPQTASTIPNSKAAINIIEKSVENAFTTHRKQTIWCFLGLPLTIPFAINPFVPNFPGMYLVYRIWCNWRAIQAAKHLKFLIKHHQLKSSPIPALDRVYETNKVSDSMKTELAEAINRVFADDHLYKELQQAVRQTRPNPKKQ